MKTGYNEATAMKKSNLVTDLYLAEKYHYDYIEIRLDMLQDYLATHTLNDLAQYFAAHSVKPYALNAIEEINCFTEAAAQKKLDEVKYACEIAQKIDNPYLIVVPSFRDAEILKKTEAQIEENTVALLNRMADMAEKFGVKIALEPVGFKTCAVKSMGQAWNIVKKTNRKNVGLVLDAFNVYIYDRLADINVLDEIDGDKIFVFHINDCEGKVALADIELNHRVWPGDGVIPLNQILNKLYQKHFDKIASVELFREDYWQLDPDEVFKTGMQKTREQLEKYYHA